MRTPAGLRHSFGRTFTELPARGRPFGVDVAQTQQIRTVFRDHHEIDPVRKEILPRPEALPAQALDTRSRHGVPHLLRDDQAQPCDPCRRRLRRDEQNEVRARDPPAGLLNP